MFSSRDGYGGFVIVLLAVVAFAALLVLSAAGPAAAGASGTPAPTGARPAVLTGSQIPAEYRLHLGGALPLTDLGSTPTPASPTSGPGPQPNDLPFAPNVPVWTDAANQNRPTEARDSQGRTYIVFQSEVTPTNHDLYVARSDDDGRTWMAPVAVTTTAADETNPSIIVSSGDRLTVFLQQNANPDAFAYAYSTDRGGSWTIQAIGFGGTPILHQFEYPSFVANGVGAMGMYGTWCTQNNPPPNTCSGGSWTVLMLFSTDISSPSAWSAIYFAQPPDVELFHPSVGVNSGNGDLVGSMEIEIYDNTAWDVTWFRFNPTPPGFFSQDGIMCGPGSGTCASNAFVWPSIAVDGPRIVTGAHFFNTNLTNHIEILAVFSTNGGGTYALVNGNTGFIDNSAVDKKYVSFDVKGPQVFSAFWKGNAVWYAGGTAGGATFQSAARVSDNSPATAIDQQHAVVVRNSTAGPLVAWHDNRDGNANIYFASFQRYTITIATNPANLLVRFDNGAWQPAPATAQFPSGTSHRIEGQSPQPGGPGVRYAFSQWNDASGVNPRTITISADTTYTATFRTQFNITVTSNPVGRTVSVDSVPQTAPYSFWCNASATATLDAPSPQTVSPTSQYRFNTWSDAGAQAHQITCDAAKVVTANFVLQWQVTIATNPAGRDVVVDSQTRVGPYVFWCDDGSSHTISAPGPQATGPGTQYRYDTWSDAGAQTHSITCTASTTVTANFVLQFQITITTTPAGRAVTVDSIPRTGPYTSFWDAGSNIGLLVPTPQSVGSTTRYSFSAWSDGNPSPVRALLVDQPRQLGAVFTTEYYLTMTTTPGTNVVPGSGWHQVDENIAISTTGPADGLTDRYRFSAWSGDFTGTNPTATITMDGPKTINANWAHQYKIDIRFGAGVPGTSITVDTVDTAAPITVWWAEGSTHTVAAPPNLAVGSDTRYNFLAWQGAGVNRQFSVTVSGAATYTATYTEQFLVTLTVSPSGRTILVDGTAWTGTPLWFDANTQHVFDGGATPQDGAAGERFKFSGWTGGPTGNVNTVLVDAPKVLVATYTRQVLLTVDSSYGTPTCLSPAEPGTCWYTENTQAQVTITSPVQVGGTKYAFTAWTGVTSSSGTTATVTMDGPKTVTAGWREVTFVEENGVYLGLVLAIIIAAIIIALIVLRRRKKEPGIPAGMPPPPPMQTQGTQMGGTKNCPACGMEIPGGATTCPVCGAAV